MQGLDEFGIVALKEQLDALQTDLTWYQMALRNREVSLKEQTADMVQALTERDTVQFELVTCQAREAALAEVLRAIQEYATGRSFIVGMGIIVDACKDALATPNSDAGPKAALNEG